MTTLLLRLAGPTQGWDTHQHRVGDPTHRPIARTHPAEALAPTTSGIIGFLGAALGRPWSAPDGRLRIRPELADLAACDIVVRADQPGRPRLEFRTTRRRIAAGMAVSPRAETVLDDAVFLVGVDGPDSLVDEITTALHAPRYALFLGKREFPPTLPILLGTTALDAETAARGHEWLAARWWREREHQTVRLRVYRPHLARRHTPDAADELADAEIDNPAGRPAPDWLSAL
ncbi:MAG: CRISPR-associated protein Cas5 [Gordonia sp. (in: high G+C Gram-positive bacteria)]